jgi:hypothetical protein
MGASDYRAIELDFDRSISKSSIHPIANIFLWDSN